MDILEAYDLTGSFRDAGELAGCSHHTVARYVRARDEGRLVPGAPSPRPGVIDGFLPKLEELVERSKGRVRADVAHEKITAMGYGGSERTTRRAVARLKKAWHSGRRRVFRPWVPEPGMWAQYDFGDGPEVAGAATVLFCLWLAWSRFRVVLPILDKTQASVWAAVDVALRRVGGVPAYLLTDNEKTVTVEHVAGMPVRNPGAVEFGRHYGLTVATCVPYDPASKGGSESTVKLAKADLVPTAANLLGEYASFAALEAACAAFCEQVNARPHRVTRRAPAEMLGRRAGPAAPGPGLPVHRGAGRDPPGGRDVAGVVRGRPVLGPAPARGAGRARPPARGARSSSSTPACKARPRSPATSSRRRAARAWTTAHYPPAPPGALNREPKARTAAEAEFLAIGRRRRAVAGRGRRGRSLPGPVQDGPGRPARRPARDRAGRPGARAGRRSRPVRRRRPGRGPRPPGVRAHPASRPGPGSPAPSPRAPAAGLPATAGREEGQ